MSMIVGLHGVLHARRCCHDYNGMKQVVRNMKRRAMVACDLAVKH